MKMPVFWEESRRTQACFQLPEIWPSLRMRCSLAVTQFYAATRLSFLPDGKRSLRAVRGRWDGIRHPIHRSRENILVRHRSDTWDIRAPQCGSILSGKYPLLCLQIGHGPTAPIRESKPFDQDFMMR